MKPGQQSILAAQAVPLKGISPYTIQILYKYYTNTKQIQYKYNKNTIQILYKYYTNTIQISSLAAQAAPLKGIRPLLSAAFMQTYTFKKPTWRKTMLN